MERRKPAKNADQRDLDAARLTAWRAVREASDVSVQRISDEMEGVSGLTLEWYNVLLHLYQSQDRTLPQNKLEEHARLSQSGISRMLSKMQQAGLLRRRPSERDRRNLDVELTDHGRDVFLRATPGHHAAVQQHFGTWLSDTEVAGINSGLHKVISAGANAPGRGSELDQLLAFGESVLTLTSGALLVADAIRTRDALEPSLLQDAARNITAEGVHELREIVTRMSRLVDAPEEFFRADWDLHRKLAQYSGNAILTDVYLSLLEILSSHLGSVVPTGNLRGYLHERLTVHAQVVDAVASGNRTLVEQAAHAHHYTDVRSRLVDVPSSELHDGPGGVPAS